MSRKDDLEQAIRESYKIINEYQAVIRTSDRAEEKARAQHRVQEQWALTEEYLDEYRTLAEGKLPRDVAEIAARFSSEATDAPPEPSPGPMQRLPWRWLVALSGTLIGVVVVILVLCALAPLHVALKTAHGTYVTALGEDPVYDVLAKTVVIDDCQIFTLIVLDDGRVAFKTCHNRYLSARDERVGYVISGTATVVLDWEKFTLIPQDDGTVALKTFHERYVTALGEDKGWDVIAETKEILAFEKFEFVPVGFCTKMRAFFGFVPW